MGNCYPKEEQGSETQRGVDLVHDGMVAMLWLSYDTYDVNLIYCFVFL